MTIVKQLLGHVDQDSAYVVADYPYGYTTRTSIRYWVETKKNFGQRFCSQTLNPKSGKWNTPKCGTYCEVLVIGLNENDYVTHAGLTHYDDAEQWRTFAAKYVLDDAIAARIDEVAKVKELYKQKEAELIAAGKPAYCADVLKACVQHQVKELTAPNSAC